MGNITITNLMEVIRFLRKRQRKSSADFFDPAYTHATASDSASKLPEMLQQIIESLKHGKSGKSNPFLLPAPSRSPSPLRFKI